MRITWSAARGQGQDKDCGHFVFIYHTAESCFIWCIGLLSAFIWVWPSWTHMRSSFLHLPKMWTDFLLKLNKGNLKRHMFMFFLFLDMFYLQSVFMKPFKLLWLPVYKIIHKFYWLLNKWYFEKFTKCSCRELHVLHCRFWLKSQQRHDRLALPAPDLPHSSRSGRFLFQLGETLLLLPGTDCGKICQIVPIFSEVVTTFCFFGVI